MPAIKDRRDLVLVALALIVVGVFTAVSAQGPARTYPPLSASSPNGDGLLGASQWLAALGYQTETISVENVGRLTPNRTTVVLFETDGLLGGRQENALLRWARQGGTLVVGDGASFSSLLARLGASLQTIGRAPIRVTQPLIGHPPLAHVRGAVRTGLATVRGVTVLMAGGTVVLNKLALGSGHVWLFGDPWVLDNAQIADQGHAALLTTLAGPAPRTVAFVKLTRAAGVASAPAAANSNWLFVYPWGIALLFAAGVVLFYRWLGGIRLGPPLRQKDDEYRPSIEYVRAVAGLLRKTKRRADVLELYQTRVRHMSRLYPSHEPVPDELVTHQNHVSESDFVRMSARLAALLERFPKSGPESRTMRRGR